MVQLPDLQALLTDAAPRHGVPGATAAVLAGDTVHEAATGLLSTATRVETTPDSVFQIGSITKVYTATLVMQLVDEGKIGLDDTAQSVLPSFAVADPEVSRTVTVRHLLTHTSGIDGDCFEDTGRGDDCVEKFVAACASLGQTHPLGATQSYCNTGYRILGRIVEVITGLVWDDALQERIVQPLGLPDTVTLPEDALLRRAAVGHTTSPETGRPVPVKQWMLWRASGPAGLICATARDVLGFVRLHLNGGLAPDGTRVLSTESVAAMQQQQVLLPDRWTLGNAWGLGWILNDWDGHRVFGHGGNTLGQAAYLKVLPEARLALTVLTNGGDAGALGRELEAAVFAAAGVTPPARPQVPDVPARIDVEPYLGRYERLGVSFDVQRSDGGGLEAVYEIHGPLRELTPNPRLVLPVVPIDGELFVASLPGSADPVPMVFFDFDGGRPRYMHFGARANRRVT
jgi:CubicO group peptidase (beta-lactamase class C family)